MDISQAMTLSLSQATTITYLKIKHNAIFFGYAPLQKIAMKSCKQDISKNYLNCCTET